MKKHLSIEQFYLYFARVARNAMWRKVSVGLVLGTMVGFSNGCKHIPTESAHEMHRDLGKNSYTPRLQKDVRELINLGHAPF